MKRWALVVGLAALLVGCNTDKGKSAAPLAPVATVVSMPGATLETIQTEAGPVKAWVTTRKDGIHLQRILYYCDFPMGYYGPPAPGHCYEDGSGCTGPPIGGDPGLTAAPAPLPGDPTADDADNDGVVIH